MDMKTGDKQSGICGNAPRQFASWRESSLHRSME
jgi:hypothetical protein